MGLFHFLKVKKVSLDNLLESKLSDSEKLDYLFEQLKRSEVEFKEFSIRKDEYCRNLAFEVKSAEKRYNALLAEAKKIKHATDDGLTPELRERKAKSKLQHALRAKALWEELKSKHEQTSAELEECKFKIEEIMMDREEVQSKIDDLKLRSKYVESKENNIDLSSIYKSIKGISNGIEAKEDIQKITNPDVRPDYAESVDTEVLDSEFDKL